MAIIFLLTVLIIYLCLVLLLYLISKLHRSEEALFERIGELVIYSNEVTGRLGWVEITTLEILKRLEKLETKDTQS